MIPTTNGHHDELAWLLRQKTCFRTLPSFPRCFVYTNFVNMDLMICVILYEAEDPTSAAGTADPFRASVFTPVFSGDRVAPPFLVGFVLLHL